MRYSGENHKLQIKLDTKDCELSAGEIVRIEGDLATLRKLVEDFPVATLHILVAHHARSNDYHVKLSLILPGQTLFTGDRDTAVHPALDRCVGKLVRKVAAYKQRMSGDDEIAKQMLRTHQILQPTAELDLNGATAAVEAGDYMGFRDALLVFEEPLRKSIGRWIQRYPDVESRLGRGLEIDDLVEDVLRAAFEHFASRPQEVPLGTWLNRLVHMSVRQDRWLKG